MAAFLYLEGITGDVAETHHKGWIKLESVGWGGGRSVKMPKHSQDKRAPGTPSFREVVCKREIDKSSFAIADAFFRAKAFTSDSKIDFVRTGDSSGVITIRQFILTNVIISSLDNWSESGDGLPLELIPLNYDTFSTKDAFAPVSNIMGVGGALTGFDLGQGKPL